MQPTVASELERYLRSGETDVWHTAWAGDSFLARARNARRDLRDALVAEVRRRSAGARVPHLPSAAEIVALTRRKVEPMVRGLFPRAEQDRVLALVEGSVVFLTPDSIESVLRGESFDSTAWTLANLYLASVNAPLLGPDARDYVGLSQGTTCFVSPAYFEEEEPFADFIVHEVAHVFHNCKREHVGLPHSRRREWLLDIAFRQRETFAYACEAYAHVVAGASRIADRVALAATFEGHGTGDSRVDASEVSQLVCEAAGHRNGWKVILARCRPEPRSA